MRNEQAKNQQNLNVTNQTSRQNAMQEKLDGNQKSQTQKGKGRGSFWAKIALLEGMIILLAATVSVGVFLNKNSSDTPTDGTTETGVQWSYDEGQKTLCLAGSDEAGAPITLTEDCPWEKYIQHIKHVEFSGHFDKIAYKFGKEDAPFSSLESVSMRNASIRIIGEDAFANCMALHTVSLPENLAEIEHDAFRQCYALWDIFFGDVKKIGDGAFLECGITELSLPNSLKEIGAFAFASCRIYKLKLGKSVEIIGGNAFTSEGIETVTVPNTVRVLGDNNGSESSAFTGTREIFYEGTQDDWEKLTAVRKQ